MTKNDRKKLKQLEKEVEKEKKLAAAAVEKLEKFQKERGSAPLLQDEDGAKGRPPVGSNSNSTVSQ